MNANVKRLPKGPLQKWTRRAAIAAATLILLGGCTQTEKRATTQYMFWPPAPDLPRVQFLTAISSTADITHKQGQLEDFLYGKDKTGGLPFTRPYGIRMQDGKMYVCDSSQANVSVLDFRKKEVHVLGTTGTVRLAKPIDIAVAPDGIKYVSDTGHGAVLVYDDQDKYAGRVSGKDLRPVGVTVQGNELFVCDVSSVSRVRVFDRYNGKELRQVGAASGSEGFMGGPMGLSFDPEGNLFVVDFLGCMVQKFAADGKFLTRFGRQGDQPGQFVRPKLMTVDSGGIVYVVDVAIQNVQMFNSQGQMLMSFGGVGAFPGAMSSPAGICASDNDLDLFASFVHPAFQAKRLILVTNQAQREKINVYALGELKPGKTLKDIAGERVNGVFGYAEKGAGERKLELAPEEDAGPSSTSAPATVPASAPTTTPAPQMAPQAPQLK